MVLCITDTGLDYVCPDLVTNVWNNVGEISSGGIDNDSNGFVTIAWVGIS
jgi:hypothetical protein